MSSAWPPAPGAAGFPGSARAGLLRRTGALLIDLLIVGLLALVGGGALSATASLFTKQSVPWAILVALSLLVLGTGPFAYFGICWGRGATLGMRACELRVVNDADGARLALPQVVLRLAGAVYSAAFLFVGFVWVRVDRRGRSWHDHYAGSRVVHELAPTNPGPQWGAAQSGAPAQWPRPAPGWGVTTRGAMPGWPPPAPQWAPAPHWGPGPPGPQSAGSPPWSPHPGGWDPPPLLPPWTAESPPLPVNEPPAPQTDQQRRLRSGWRALATHGRPPWTWTDVAPVMLLFIPLLDLSGRLLVRAVVQLQHGRPHGTTRAVDTVIVDLASYLPALLILFALVGLRRHGHLRDLGLCRVNLRWIGAVIPFVMAAYVFEAATGVISVSLFPNTPANQCTALSQEFGGYALVALATAVVAAPFVEELFFRGFLLRYLRGRMPIGWAVVISSAIFSLAHFQYGQPTLFLPIFTTGLVLGAIYHYSGSIWPGVLTHGTFNLVATIQLLLHPHC